MSFVESPRFPFELARGMEGGPTFLTNIVVLGSGWELRDGQWDEPLYEWDAASAVHDSDDLHLIKAWFMAVRGQLFGFRLKDFSDFKSCGPLQTPMATDQIICAAATAGQTTVQITKTYSAGALSLTVPVKKPVPDTLLVKLNANIITTGFTVDTTTGIITFTTALSANDVVRAGYEFDQPVRFLNDRLPTKMEMYRSGDATIPLKGIRV